MANEIALTAKGDFPSTTAFLKKLQNGSVFNVLNQYGQMGVAALAAATPKESGETAASWTYEVQITSTGAFISWKNTHMAGDKSVAVLLQYGHGTGTGGYVVGRDFINPAIRPVFDKIAAGVWEGVIK